MFKRKVPSKSVARPLASSMFRFVKLSIDVNEQILNITVTVHIYCIFCIHRHLEGVLQRIPTTGRAETRWGEYLT